MGFGVRVRNPNRSEGGVGNGSRGFQEVRGEEG